MNLFVANNNYRISVSLAIALHAILFIVLFMRFTSSQHLTNAEEVTHIINATVVNQTPTANPLANPQNSSASTESSAKTETAQLPKPIKQTSQRQLITNELMQQQQAVLLKKQQQEKMNEHKRLVAEQLKQELAAEQKTAKAKQELAAKKAAEQVAKELMQSEMATDAANDAKSNTVAATAATHQGEIDKYKTMIIQAISRQWVIPDDLKKGLEARLLVTLAPGGMVLNIKIVQSSGDSVLDRSAETAVYKASPLPVPSESELFNNFRTLNLVVRPEGILAGE